MTKSQWSEIAAASRKMDEKYGIGAPPKLREESSKEGGAESGGSEGAVLVVGVIVLAGLVLLPLVVD